MVKNAFRTGIAIFLLTLYSLAAGAAKVSALHSSAAVQNDLYSLQDSYYSTLAINLFCPVSTSASSLGAGSHTLLYEVKYPFGLHFAPAQVAEDRLGRAFAQYALDANTFPVRLRKADIIFPFHYFW